MLAFRGADGEPPRRNSVCGVSPFSYSHRSLAPYAPIKFYILICFLKNLLKYNQLLEKNF